MMLHRLYSQIIVKTVRQQRLAVAYQELAPAVDADCVRSGRQDAQRARLLREHPSVLNELHAKRCSPRGAVRQGHYYPLRPGVGFLTTNAPPVAAPLSHSPAEPQALQRRAEALIRQRTRAAGSLV